MKFDKNFVVTFGLNQRIDLNEEFKSPYIVYEKQRPKEDFRFQFQFKLIFSKKLDHLTYKIFKMI